MGSCMSAPAQPEEAATSSNPEMQENKRTQKERSHAIDKQIEEDSKKYRKECKILLLGAWPPLLLAFLLSLPHGQAIETDTQLH